MSLIKSLIQRLLDSRTTPAQAAHSASSVYAEPTYFNGTPTAGNDWVSGLYTGTAPTDGYLNVSGTAYINAADAGAMVQAQIGGAQISQVSPMSGQGFNMMAPISKGASFSVNGIRLSDLTVRFFKAIGGGVQTLKKLILQGGGLCLNSSSSSLRRSSWLARKDKSLRLLLPRLTTVSRFPRDGREQINGQKPLQLLLTAGLELKEFAQALFIWMSALIKTNCAKGRIETLALSRVFAECLREQRSTTSLQQAAPSLRERFCSFQATAPQLNVANGGASC